MPSTGTVDIGEPGSIDSIHAHKPSVITWNGRLEHYYCAVAPQPAVRMGGIEQHELRGIARATNVGT